ncbi:MAG: gliding motility lipoprotein GldH [Flavobacteriaceae bacterium]
MDKRLGILLCIVFMAACQPAYDTRQYIDYPSGWPKDQAALFDFQLTDEGPRQLYLHLRNSNDYPFSNIFLISQLKSPEGLIVQDTLEYAMTDAQGAWLGKGAFDLKESRLWWLEKAELPVGVPLQIYIRQAVRQNGEQHGLDTLPGIVSVGFSVEPVLKDN